MEAGDERMWVSRLRWRLRGAWQWPAFALLTLADALLLHWLPFSGHDGSPVVAGFLISGFVNLALVAVGGPLLGRALRRRRAELPAYVAADRAGTTLMIALCALVLLGGALNHGDVSAAGADRATALRLSRGYDRVHAPARFRPGIGHENILDTGARLFRVCVPGPERRRTFCVYVDAAASPPTLRPDPEQTPNSVLAGPDNPGRQVGG